MVCYIYTDDTLATVTFEPADEGVCPENLERCLHEIKHYMATNLLRLEDSKTEFIIFGRKQCLKQVITEVVTI